jgi:dCTP deaminase
VTILSAQSIRRRIGMIYPFCERATAFGMTYGLGPSGYDIRIDKDLLLWPLGFACADTLERFAIPLDLKPCVQDKSTWARRGVCVQNTTMDPGWRGYLRLEITNHSWRFHRLRAGMPIAQVEFNLLDEPTEQGYRGKYQDQRRGQKALLTAQV